MGRAKTLFLAAAAAYFLAHAVPKAGEAMKVFEWEYFSAAESVLTTGVPMEYGTRQPAIEHPPLYVHALAGVMQVFGVNMPAARLMGVVLALLSCIPLYLLAGTLGGGWAAFAAAAALFLSAPAAIQGSGIIGAADTGLFPPLLFFLCWALLRSRGSGGPLWPAAAAAFFCLCLWAKFTTSVVLPPFFLAWRAACRDWRGLKQELGIFAAGAAAFALSWAAYAYLVPGADYLWWPISYPLQQFAAGIPSGNAADKLLRLFAETLRVTAWFSPFLLFAAASCLVGRREERVPGAREILLLAAFIFLGYTAVRGTGGGFPKYQFPALALFCLAAGLRFARELPALNRRGLAVLLSSCAAAFLFHRLVLGDAVLYVQELLRFAAVSGAGSAAWRAAGGAALYLAPFAALVPVAARLAGWGSGRAFFLVSLSFAIGYNISQNSLQLAAPYSTTYAYGTSGAREAADFIRENTAPEDAVTGALETLYSAGNKRALMMPERAWSSPGGFLEFLASARPAAVVCGLGTNTAEQQAKVFDSPQVRGALSKEYEERVFGSYVVWLKKERNK